MDHVPPVAILNGLEQLVNEVADGLELNAVRVLLEHFEQVLLQVFKHQVQTVHPRWIKQESEMLTEKVEDAMSYFLKHSWSVTMFSCLSRFSI